MFACEDSAEMEVIMKTISISLGARDMQRTEQSMGKAPRKTIFAGNMKQGKSVLEMRRDQMKKQAMKMVRDTFDVEKKQDSVMESLRTHKEELYEENRLWRSERQALQDKLDSKDLSVEDRVEIEKAVEEYNARISKNDAEAVGDSKTIQSMKLERLKSQPMADAAKASEQMQIAASKDFAFALMNEAKENIDKKMEENNKRGEKLQEQLKEKQEALEESVEKRKEREEALQERIEENAESAANLMKDISKEQEEINEELDRIRKKMKMLEEDLKGAAMDTRM